MNTRIYWIVAIVFVMLVPGVWGGPGSAARSTIVQTNAEAPAPEGKTSAVLEGAAESGKNGLNGRTRFPWYDASKDDLRAIPVTATEDDKDDHRSSQWNTTTTPTTTGPATSSSFARFIGEIVRVLFYLVIAAAFIALVIMLIRAYLRNESRTLSTDAAKTEEEIEADIDRVESLPFQVAAPKGDMLTEAERNYNAGNYNAAIIYLFSYELMQLDKAQVIRLTRGKTNRQYVREARHKRELADILRNTMAAFEDVFFGHHDLGRQRFEVCWNELREFQRFTAAETAVAV